MKEIKRFPQITGTIGWFEFSKFKNHQFANVSDLEKSYDFVIIGGGFAGVNAAFRLAENRPHASIALFEALKIGQGDSGRNAGFLMDVPHSFGEPGAPIAQYKYRRHLDLLAIARLRSLINNHKLKVDWLESGKYLSCHESRFLKNLDGAARVLDEMDIPYQMVEAQELHAKLGTSYYQRALYTSGSCLINPSEVVRGLASVLPQNIDVFEQMPVVHVEEGRGVVIRLANGRQVKAGKLLLLAGVFIDRFGIKQQGRMTPAGSFGAFTRALSDEEMRAIGNVAPWGCTAAHAAGSTVRLLSNRRIYVRNGLVFPTHLDFSPHQLARAEHVLRRAFENRFPMLKHVDFDYSYAGMIPLTLNGQSFFMQMGDNIFAAAVGDGAGLTCSTTLGIYLADFVCGVDSEELRYLRNHSSPRWCPPEPFKTIAANARMKMEEFCARGEI